MKAIRLTGISVFFLLTGGALILAIHQTVLVFCGASRPDFGAAIGELLLVIVLAIGEIIAFVGLWHAAKERKFHCWLRAQELWTEQSFREARGRVFQRLRNPNAPWTEKEKDEAKDVCRRMDEFAHLAPYLGTRTVLDTWDDPLAKAWVVLEQVVNEEQTGEAHWSVKWSAFAEIGREALAKMIREGRDPRPKQLNG